MTVGYATTALTATAGSDYDDASGTLTFDPGVSTLPLSVTVRADALTEGVETFRVDLSGPSGAAIAYGQATGRIHDPGNLFTVAPCRVLDTRDPAGPYGGPALGAGPEPRLHPRRPLRHPGVRARGDPEPDRHRAHGAGQPAVSTRRTRRCPRPRLSTTRPARPARTTRSSA